MYPYTWRRRHEMKEGKTGNGDGAHKCQDFSLVAVGCFALNEKRRDLRSSFDCAFGRHSVLPAPVLAYVELRAVDACRQCTNTSPHPGTQKASSKPRTSPSLAPRSRTSLPNTVVVHSTARISYTSSTRLLLAHRSSRLTQILRRSSRSSNRRRARK